MSGFDEYLDKRMQDKKFATQFKKEYARVGNVKVWAFIDWYDADRLRLFRSKKDVYKYTEEVYHELYGKKLKLTDKNLEEICSYVGLTVKQIKVN